MLSELQEIRESGTYPRLLLHSCCAPCSSAVIERLSRDLFVTVLYYNPNLYPEEEYLRRKEEQIRFLAAFPAERPVDFLDVPFDQERFASAVRGLEGEPEGGERCTVCFRLRLYETARRAKEGGYGLFTTTLTISPRKDAERLNRIGEEAGAAYGVRWFPGDHKKQEGFKRSTELSREYGLYRQDYCGCIYSKQERDRQRKEREHGDTLGREIYQGNGTGGL